MVDGGKVLEETLQRSFPIGKRKLNEFLSEAGVPNSSCLKPFQVCDLSKDLEKSPLMQVAKWS